MITYLCSFHSCSVLHYSKLNLHACSRTHTHTYTYIHTTYTYSCTLSISLSLSFSTHTHTHTQLVYCLVHFTGDDRVPPYVNRLINPSIQTEEKSEEDKTLSSFYQEFDEEDYLTLQTKDPETLFQDSTYMKHLRRHANK